MAFSFGANKGPVFGQTTSAPSFGFGSTTTTTPFAFGTTTSASAPSFGTSTSLFGGFNQPKTTASTGFTFGGGGFNQPKTTASTGFTFGGGGFNQPKTTASTGFTFGTTTTAGGGLFGGATAFGQKPTTTASTGFSFGGGNTSSSLFGGATAFGQKPAGTTLFSNTSVTQAPTSDAATHQLANLVTAVTGPVLFNDERDVVVAKWNQIQSFWGTGRAFANQSCSIQPDTTNPFCRFKSVGYSKVPSTKDEDGLVAVTMAKTIDLVKSSQQQIVDELYKAVQSKPELSVCVDSVVEVPEGRTELVIYINQRDPNGTTKRIPASTLSGHFNNMKAQPPLSTLGISCITPKISFNDDQLKQYLDNPPQGVDPLVWQQAKMDNPDPDNLIPVPILGFTGLNNRLQLQDLQSKMHKAALVKISSDIAELQRNHANTTATLEQHKRKHLELGHRVLQVMAKQEIYRKLGHSIQGDEEQLRVHLEAIQAEINAPTQFKGRLNELMSHIRMQNQLLSCQSEPNYTIDQQMQHEIRQHLKQQQEGLQHLISIIKDDVEGLQLIEQGMASATRK